MTADPIVPGAAARSEAKAYLRIETAGEDALLDRLIAAAIGHGEAFTGRLWLARTVKETVPAACGWRRLGAGPVRSIATVTAQDGGLLPVGGYSVDIDAAGDGWVQAPAVASLRLAATYSAGLAEDWSGLPEPLRQGAIRLAAHLYTHRDTADEGAPPAAVAALWRPWRRLSLLGGFRR